MMKSELLELMKINEMDQETYNALEKWYIAIDLDKKEFAAIVKAVGVKALVDRQGRAEMINEAVEAYQRRKEYQRNICRLAEIDREKIELTDAIEAYKKAYK